MSTGRNVPLENEAVAPQADPAARSARSPLADVVVFAVSLVLSALAGFVDAVGFVAFGGLFVSFMAGDGTRAAIDASGHAGKAAAPALAIVVFIVGVVVGELVGAASGRWGRVAVLAVESLLLWAAVAIARAMPEATVVVSLLGLAMGVQNASVHKTEGVDVALTYVTGMIVHVARSIAHALRGEPGWRAAGPLAALWAAVLLGSIAGAVVVRQSSLAALVVAALAASLMTGVAVAMTVTRIGDRRLP